MSICISMHVFFYHFSYFQLRLEDFYMLQRGTVDIFFFVLTPSMASRCRGRLRIPLPLFICCILMNHDAMLPSFLSLYSFVVRYAFFRTYYQESMISISYTGVALDYYVLSLIDRHYAKLSVNC